MAPSPSLPGIDPRARLLRALRGETVDRPPVICPGGMMTMATLSAMERSGCAWPAAHFDAGQMADLVTATREETGLECLSVPFCMTVEAEALGCCVDYGTTSVLPHVSRECLTDASQIPSLPYFDGVSSGRAPVVLGAIRRLKSGAAPFPVIGSVVGPVTLAAMVMEAGIFLRLLRRNPQGAQAVIAAMESVTTRFALAQHAAGADAILMSEPSATGEVLGGDYFARFALPAIGRCLRALQDAGVPTILHICGDVRPILRGVVGLVEEMGGRLPLSVDAMVGGGILADAHPGIVRVGNVDALLLERGEISAIERAGRRAARDFHVVSPACGLVPATPAENLRALTDAVRGNGDKGKT